MIQYIKSFKGKVQNTLNIFLLKGENVICEMCNWKGKYFPNRRCPKCKSLARTRLIPFSLRHFNIPKSEIALLHVAPNISEYNYVIDNFDCSLYDRLNITFAKHINLNQDLTKTSIKNNTYDLIIIWHVLEHIPNDIEAISEMYRILKPNGKLLVSVPIYPKNNPTTFEDENIPKSDYQKIHGHHDHCRSCGLDYYQRFEKLNFKTKTLHVKDLNKNDIEKYGLSEGHTVWLFEKY